MEKNRRHSINAQEMIATEDQKLEPTINGVHVETPAELGHEREGEERD